MFEKHLNYYCIVKQNKLKWGGVNFSFLKSAKMLATAALATIALQTSAQNQQRTWTLPPNRVNFAPTTGTAALPLATAGQYRAANGAYDASGNLLFYVKELNVYRGDGTSMGALTGYQYTNSGALGCGGLPITANVQFKEIAIVPVPNSCSKYYVVWTGSSLCNSQLAYAHYATVDVIANTVINLASASNLGGNFTTSAAIAVSKVKADGFRKLYILGGSKIVTFTIGATAITQVGTTTLTNYSYSAVAPAASELELSPDGTQLAWGDYNNPVGYRIQSIPTTGILATTYDMNNNNKFPIATTGWVSGTEFDASGNVYYNLNSFTTNTHNGIWKILSTSTAPASFRLTGANTTSSFNSSQLELGYDGKLYAINNSNQMVAVDLATSTPSVVNSGISVQSNGTNTVATFSHYSLPDQIDGENYSYFVGNPVATFTNMLPYNGGVLTEMDGEGNYFANNCLPVTIVPTSTNATQYKISIFTSDIDGYADGSYTYTSAWVAGAFPTTQDLRTWAGTSNYMQNNPGRFYSVSLQLWNGCSSSNPITRNSTFYYGSKLNYVALYVDNNTTRIYGNSDFTYPVYNCSTIKLNPTAYNATKYKLTVYSSDINGNQISGPTKLYYIGGLTTGVYNNSFDLSTLASNQPNSSTQANYMQNNTGYFKAILEESDNCNPALVKSVVLNVSSITAASSDFQFNYGDGNLVAIPVGQTYSNPVNTGQNYVGVNAIFSTGYLDYYKMRLEKVNASTGVVTEVVCDNPANTTIANKSSSSLGSIPLNGYIFNKCSKPNNYLTLSGNTNLVYKLTFTVGNVCGSTNKVGYFRNSDASWRIGDANESAGGDVLQSLNEVGHVVFPNPSQEQATLYYVLTDAMPVSLILTDANGNKLKTIMENNNRAAGQYTQTISLDGLPDGIYYYRLNTDKALVGKIVKSSK